MDFQLDKMYELIQKYYRSSPETYWPENDPNLTYREAEFITFVEIEYDRNPTKNEMYTIVNHLPYWPDDEWDRRFVAHYTKKYRYRKKERWDNVLKDKVGKGVKTAPKSVRWQELPEYKERFEAEEVERENQRIEREERWRKKKQEILESKVIDFSKGIDAIELMKWFYEQKQKNKD